MRPSSENLGQGDLIGNDGPDSLFFKLCRGLAVQQAEFLDGLSLDLLLPSEDRVCVTEEDVSGRHFAKALVVSVVVIGDIPSLHRRAEPPNDDVADVVVEDRRQVQN